MVCPNGHTIYKTYGDWREEEEHQCPICIKQPFKKVSERPTKKKGYRVLAFDQASITSGWSLFEDNKLLTYGKWTSNGQKSTQRISQTKAWVASLIDSHQPDVVIFEDIQLQKFSSEQGGEGAAVTTYKKLAHLQGVLKNYCYEAGIPYEIAAPATWRTYSNVKGKSRTDKKRSAQLIVEKIYEIKVTEDEADAILIGRWAAAQYKKNEIIMF